MSTRRDAHDDVRWAGWLGRREERWGCDRVTACIFVPHKKIETCSGRCAFMLWSLVMIVGCLDIYQL